VQPLKGLRVQFVRRMGHHIKGALNDQGRVPGGLNQPAQFTVEPCQAAAESRFRASTDSQDVSSCADGVIRLVNHITISTGVGGVDEGMPVRVEP